MKLFKTFIENKKLRDEVDYLRLENESVKNEIIKTNRNYRHLLGVRQELNERIEMIDHALYNSNKTIREILEVANSKSDSRTKVKKIIELANKNDSSSIK